MAGQIPENYHLTRPAKLDGDAVVSYPYGTDHRRIERYFTVFRGTDPTAWSAIDKEYASATLTERTNLGGDAQCIYVYEVYEDLPGPAIADALEDSQHGPVSRTRQRIDRVGDEVASIVVDNTGHTVTRTTYESQAADNVLSKVVEVYAQNGQVMLGQDYDRENGVVIPFTTQVQDFSDPNVGAPALGTNSTDVNPIDTASSSIKSYNRAATVAALSDVVRSYDLRMSLDLPRVLAGLVSYYNVQHGDGKDDGLGHGYADSDTYSVNVSASASANGSISIIPEVYPAIRTYNARNVPASLLQVYVQGYATEAKVLAAMAAVYEVQVSTGGTLVPDARGPFKNLGPSAPLAPNSYAFSTYVLEYDATQWKLGTVAGIAAGNYWGFTASSASPIGTYAPHGTNTGTAVVGAGRSIALIPDFDPQEIIINTRGAQVNVSCNASASDDVRFASASRISESVSTRTGFSTSTGGSRGTTTVPPTIHGALSITHPSYTATVDAPVTAGLAGTGVTLVSAGIDSTGHGKTVTASIFPTVFPATTPADIPLYGLYLDPGYHSSPFDADNMRVTGAVVDFAYFAKAPGSIEYSESDVTYTTGDDMAPNAPIYFGGKPTSYAITGGTRPTGVVFNTTTGVLSGNPDTNLARTVFTVTATNALGSVTCPLILTFITL